MGFRKIFGLKGRSSNSHDLNKKQKAAAEKAINAVGELDDNEMRLEKKRNLLVGMLQGKEFVRMNLSNVEFGSIVMVMDLSLNMSPF